MPKINSDYDIRMIDGAKSVRIEDLPPEAWRTITGHDVSADSLKKLYTSVPWLFRGIDIRANALAKIPFSISKGENVVDTSMDYKNVVKFWPKPFETLSLIEASLTLTGRAYLEKAENQFGFLKVLKYLVPTTVDAKIDKKLGLTHFQRRIGGTPINLTLDQVVWFWLRDAFTEIGPPDSSPAKAAMRAAGVLFNVDTFVDSFFERGAIKATIVSVPKGTQKAERQKLTGWFKSLIAKGIKTAWSTNVVADTITTTVIGEGIQELSNTELTKEKRQDISVALGIPVNLLFSDDANFATAKQEDFRLYDQTILAEVRLIEGVLNVHVFEPDGFSIKFHPQALQIFQEEEVNRSAALVNLVRANLPTDLSMMILGYDLPPEWDFDMVAAAVKENMETRSQLRVPSERQEIGSGPNTPISSSPPQRTVLDSYRSHALKRHKEGKPIKGTKGAPAFDAGGEISNTQLAAMGSALTRVSSAEDIDRIFANAKAWGDYP